jgi:enoyl-[acyl-carrier protein] reductase / trans-2-enoyl-CoA reductase (NAD+)
MLITPMIRSNICLNAHPVGCDRFVKDQIEYIRSAGSFPGPATALIIGASGGYGLATRIALAFGAGTRTLGVSFEKPASGKRTATAGWYCNEAFTRYAQDAGLVAPSLIGDAFSHEMKNQAIETVKSELGTIDLVVYSLASGLRIDPDTGEQYRSVLKPIGDTYRSKSIDPLEGSISEAVIEPATEQEIHATVKVMGGEDWKLWMEALRNAGVLSPDAMTIAYSYIGPELTRPFYRDGTIGRAKDHLEATAGELGTSAMVSVNKAVVSRASAVIPVVPLYFAVLFKVMKEKNLHEGCIEQMRRMLTDRLYRGGPVPTDSEGRVRMDDWEMQDDVQREVARRWELVSEENVEEIADLEGYRTDFLNLHGFGYDDIDYTADVELS